MNLRAREAVREDLGAVQTRAADAALSAGREGPPIRALAAIALVAVALWAYHVWAAVVISPDSALFVEYAQRLAVDPTAALRQFDQHPLYPALILFFRQIAGQFYSADAAGWVLAGRLAGLAGYIGSIIAAYALASRVYDRRIGLLTVLLLAVLPDAAHFGADVLSDLPHLTLYLAGLAALLAGLQRGDARWLLAAAVASALAFLTRPEGGAVVLIGVVLVVLSRGWPLRRRILLALGMAAVFAAVASPYQLATGRIIKKKSLPQLFRFGPAEADLDSAYELADAAGRPFEATADGDSCNAATSLVHADLSGGPLSPVNVLYQWGRAGRGVYALLALVGLAAARPRGTGGRILAAGFGVQAMLLCALQTSYGYLDRRHTLLLAALTLPLAAAGVLYLARRIRPAGRRAIPAVIIGLCVLLTSPWLLEPINRGQEHVRAAIGWVAGHTPADALIVGNRRLHRVALCADRDFAEWPWWNGEVPKLAEFLEQHSRPATYFIVDTLHMTTPPRNPQFFKDLSARLGAALRLVHTVTAPAGEPPTELRIYEYSVPGRG